MSETASRNLFQRIAAAAKSLNGGVHKDVTVTFGDRYKAVGHGQVVERTRDVLLDHGVLYFVHDDDGTVLDVGTTAKGSPVNIVHGRFIVEFVNVDNPTETKMVRTRATGIDSQDKAYPKASSYAKKLVVMQVLQLFGSDDAQDEERLPEPVALTPSAVPTKDEIRQLANRSGVALSEVQTWCLLHGAPVFGNLTESDRIACREWLKAGGKPFDHAAPAPATALKLLDKPPATATVAEFLDMYQAQQGQGGK